MKMSESIAEIAKALGKFQTEVKQPEKDGNNPHFKSKYVTLDGTVKAIHECAPKHGLSYIQSPIMTESGVGVKTLLMHTSGEYIEFEPFILPMDKKTAQGAGSAITYARRYSLSAAFGIVSDVDDDGNEATQPNGSGQTSGKKASEKQLNLVNTLLQAKINDKWDYNALHKNLKQKIGTNKDIENWTVSEASKAIEILQSKGA
jgi:ERF superfamily